MTRFYISGKITGLERAEAVAEFARAAEFLRGVGYDVFNPIEDETPGLSWEEYMLLDIHELFKCNAIYMLANWRESRGARIEFAIAAEMGFQIVFQDRPEN